MTAIARIACHHIRYPDPNDFGSDRQTVLVRVDSDDGLTGWGEIIAMWPEACRAAILLIGEALAPLATGMDATRPEEVWAALRRHVWWYGEGGIASMALSGIDMALWDIRGQAEGRPLFELFGGLQKERLPACACSHVNKATQEERVGDLLASYEEGYRSFKVGLGKHGLSDIGDDPDRVVAYVDALRRALGDEAEILVDIGNGIAWDVETAIAVARRLEALGVGWLEEPLYPTDDAGHARLRAATSIPIASGEREFTAAGYARLIAQGSVDVFGVDPARAEGITGFRRVDALVAAAGRTMNAHAWSTAITTAASLHLSLASTATRLFEFKPLDVVVQSDLVDAPIRQQGGWALPRDRPGLGIAVDQSVVDRLSVP